MTDSLAKLPALGCAPLGYKLPCLAVPPSHTIKGNRDMDSVHHGLGIDTSPQHLRLREVHDASILD